MDEWHDFLLAQAGAAGVLTGLVFVAVSINLQTIVSEPGSGLPGRAAEALILLVGVLTASVLLLVPGQGQVMVGAEVLVMGLATWGWVVVIQLARLRSWQAMRPDLRQAFVLRVALAQIATLPSVVAGIIVLVGGWRSILACGGHGLLDPGGFIRGVGVARRDQPVGEASSFSPPYAPQCVEGELSQADSQDTVWGRSTHEHPGCRGRQVLLGSLRKAS